MHAEYMIYQHHNTLWDLYCETFCNGQIYYVVRKSSYYALYNAHFEEIIGEPFGAEKIIPFKDRENQLIVIKNNYTGIFNIDTNTIRWGYKGVVDEKIDWIRR